MKYIASIIKYNSRNKSIINKLLQKRRDKEDQKNDGRKTWSGRNSKKC